MPPAEKEPTGPKPKSRLRCKTNLNEKPNEVQTPKRQRTEPKDEVTPTQTDKQAAVPLEE